MSERTRVPVTELLRLVHDLFAAAGVPEEAASEVAEALVRADQEGQPSHGVMMVDLYMQRIAGGSVSTRTSGEVVSDRAATAVIDAHDALGQVTARQAIGLACDKADIYGIGIVSVRNAFHFGTASRYTELAAQRGKVGMAMGNTRPLMPAPGGSERLVGNNPIGFALPTATGQPLSFDMATSQAAMGKIRMAHAQGSPIPADWATDAAGVPTTDPAAAIAGMLLPSGGAKGFGLALVIDLLSGLLSGGGHGSAVTPLFGDASVPYNSSQLFIAIDPDFFTSSEEFLAGAAQAAERVRSSARAGAPGANGPARDSARQFARDVGRDVARDVARDLARDVARAPGDARRLARESNRETVPVAPAVLTKLLAAAERYGVQLRHLDTYLTPVGT